MFPYTLVLVNLSELVTSLPWCHKRVSTCERAVTPKLLTQLLYCVKFTQMSVHQMTSAPRNKCWL